MELRPNLLATAALLVFALVEAPADSITVRLRTGVVLSGDVADATSEGFRLTRWDNGGAVYLQWEHLVPEDAHRARKRLLNQEELEKEMIDIVRLQTKGGSFPEGKILQETPDKILLRTRDGNKTIPAASVIKRETLQVEVAALYPNPKDYYDERAKGVSDSDPSGQFDLGLLCMRLGLWADADRHLAKALELDPSLKDRVDQKRARVAQKKKEQEVALLRTQVEEMIAEKKLKEARTALDQLRTEYGDVIAKADLDSLETDLAEAEKGGAGNGAIVSGRQSDEKLLKDYGSVMETLLKKPAANRQGTLQTAKEYVERYLANEVFRELAKRLKAKPEELEERWKARQVSTPRRASYGEGTWVKEGRQAKKKEDGDAGSYEDLLKSQDSDKLIEDFWNKDRRDPRTVEEEWWKGASAERRLPWLVAFAAETLFEVVEVQWSKCRTCGGKGLTGKELCKSCNGVKNEKIVVYK